MRFSLHVLLSMGGTRAGTTGGVLSGGLFDFEALDREPADSTPAPHRPVADIGKARLVCRSLPLQGPEPSAMESLPTADTAEGRGLIGLMTLAGRDALVRWQAVWQPQTNGYYCAPASALAALRFLGLGADAGLSQDYIYHKVIRPRGLFTSGVSFEHGCQLMQILGAGALEVRRVQFRDAIIVEARLAEDLALALECSETVCILANYWRPPSGGGHWSPLAGFVEGRVLVLDTNSAKGPPHWLPLSKMAQALCRHNEKTGLPRGYLVVRRLESGCVAGA